MPGVGAIFNALKGTTGKEWGRIGTSAWNAVQKGFSKRALTGAAVGAVGGAAKGAIVDYGENGQPLFSSLVSNSLKGAAIGGLAWGAGGGLLAKNAPARGFRSRLNKAFGGGIKSTLGKGTAAAAAAEKEAAALAKPLEKAAGGTPGTSSMDKFVDESEARRIRNRSKRQLKNARNALNEKLFNSRDLVAGSAGMGADMSGAGRGLRRGISTPKQHKNSLLQEIRNIFSPNFIRF